MIGPSSVLAWVMVVGVVVAFVPALLARPDGDLDPAAAALSVVAGLAYIGGLSLIYRALRIGPVTVAARSPPQRARSPRSSPSSSASHSRRPPRSSSRSSPSV